MSRVEKWPHILQSVWSLRVRQSIFLPMHKSPSKNVLFGAVAASLLLAVGNNLRNKHRVDWIGSPEVLPKPEGWPSLTFGQGIAAGMKVVSKGLHAHAAVIYGGLALLVLIMILLNRSRGARVAPMVRTVLRLGLAAMFLAAAWPKFQDPRDFAVLVAQYQMLPGALVNLFAIWLSSFEIIVGLGLILTAWEKEFSILAGALLLMFVVALGQALSRGLGIACGCFDIEGAADAGETWFSLIRDVVLLLPVAWLALTGSRRFLFQGR
jgi:hypothetical protein